MFVQGLPFLKTSPGLNKSELHGSSKLNKTALRTHGLLHLHCVEFCIQLVRTY